MTTLATQRITELTLDSDRLAADLARAARFSYNESYSEFICGSWRSCMLWNHRGDIADTHLVDHRSAALPTEFGRALPYVTELVDELFVAERLRFARLARLTPGSVLVPHRDYLELESDLLRIHLPLRTDENCFSAQEETIYQMRQGELWFLDATRTHSAASFSSTDRVHLIADFAAEDVASAVRLTPGPPGIPADSVVPRRPLRAGERESFQALAGVLDQHNYRDVLAMVIKRYFTADLPAAEIFAWMKDLGAACGQPDVLAMIEWQEEHCLVRR